MYFIHKVLSDPQIKNEFQQAGLNYVRKLDWGELAQTYFDDIHELASEPINGIAWAGN